MAKCINKNNPNFKKIVRITGLPPEDVSTAIGIWQDHFQSEGLPDAITVLAMNSNKESYGGMDQYLAAISNPVKKTDIDMAVKNLPKRAESIVSALQSIIPGIKITIHQDQDGYNNALFAASGSLKNQSSNGFYYSKEKEIHLNVNRMVQTMGDEKKRAMNSLEHEATHPILDALESINPGSTGQLYNDLLSVEKQLGLDGKYTVTFAGRYSENKRKEEAVTEFISDVAAGNIDLSKLNKTALDKVRYFFINMFKKLGINLSPYLKTEKEILRFASKIKESFNEGKRLELANEAKKISEETRFQIGGEIGVSRLEDSNIILQNLQTAREMESIPIEKYFNEYVQAQKKIEELNAKEDYSKRKREKAIAAIERMYNYLGYKTNETDRDTHKQFREAYRKNNNSLLPKSKGNLLIRVATGWERGADGKWRYEFPDPDIVDDFEKKGTIELKQIIKPESDLLKLYPELADTIVEFAPIDSQGSFDVHKIYTDDEGNVQENKSVIKINLNLIKDKEKTKSTLLHEVQHAIQNIEGFSKGGNLQNSALRKHIQKTGFNSIEELNKAIVDLRKVYKEKYNLWERKAFGKRYKGQKAETSNLLKEWRSLETRINELDKKNFNRDEAFEEYRRLAGEVEARNVQKRMNLSAEEKRQILLQETEDIAREDQILIFGDTSIRFQQNDDISLTDKKGRMTEDGDNYVFFTYGGTGSKYHTEPLPYMTDNGYNEGVIKINKKEVYPLEEDPKNLVEEGNIFDQVPKILKKITVLGYKILVANYNDGRLIAFSTGRINPVENNIKMFSNQVKESPLFTIVSDGNITEAAKYLSNGDFKGGLLTSAQSVALQEEIEANYSENGKIRFGQENMDIRQHLYNYNNPFAEKDVNGVNLRIAEGLIEGVPYSSKRKRTFLLYANGKIVGKFYSPDDAKKVVKHIEDNLVILLPDNKVNYKLDEEKIEKLRPFRNYSVELDTAFIRYDATQNKKQFNKDLQEAELSDTKNIQSNIVAAENKITIFNDYDSLANSDYIVNDGQIRKIHSTNKINAIRHSYVWSDVNGSGTKSITYVNNVGNETTTKLDNNLKFSLSETDNSGGTKTPYDESIKFGNLVKDLTVKIKEGITDIVDLRIEAGVTEDTYEVFQGAYDLAFIRAGKEPTNVRQVALRDIIYQLPKGKDRPTAQQLFILRKNMLDQLGIDLNMVKQLLPDADILKDKNINQTWKRLLQVIDDVGQYVSQTIIRGKKFEITDFEGKETGYWDHASIGFSNMISYVQNAVEQNPGNKAQLLLNVREALKDNENDDMLLLLEVAIAASGETNLEDLSKIIRSGSTAGRVLNVIKRYIGGGSFGRVKTDLAAATIMAENDAELKAKKINTDYDAPSALDLAEEIRTIITLYELSKEDRLSFFNENPELIDNLNTFLRKLRLTKVKTAPKEKAVLVRAKSKISRGVLSLSAALKRSNPELIKLSKTGIDKEAIKSIKQILRGLIDIHGQEVNKLKTELSKVFQDAGILLSVQDILNETEIKEYIANADRASIRAGVIQKLSASEDNYTKMVLDHILKIVNIPEKGANKIDTLIDALDREELTKEVLDAVIAEVNQIPDENRKAKLLEIIDKKFVTVFTGAVQAKTLNDAVAKGLGKITRQIVSDYIIDPDRSLETLASAAIDKLGLTPEQATAWAEEISQKVKARLNNAAKNKVKALLRNKIQDKRKAEALEEKIFKVIITTSDPDGSIPSAIEIDEKMLDVKQIIADKYGVKINDPKSIARIIHLTNLLRAARTQTRKEQIHAEIMLRIRNMALSPNRHWRLIKSGILELSNFIMANILSGVNTSYKAAIGGFFNSAIGFVLDQAVGRGIDWYYNGRRLSKKTMADIAEKKKSSPVSHAMLTYRLFYDLMRNGSAAISQSNIPDYGLSNFDNILNHSLVLRTIYSGSRFLSAIDRATMNLNYNRKANRYVVNSLHEFGRNNVVLNNQLYSRTAGGSSWYKVNQNGTPDIDPDTGNIKVIRDKNHIERLNQLAKNNFTETEFLAEAERLLGLSRVDHIYADIIEEWNALVELSRSPSATKEEKEEIKKLSLGSSTLLRAKTMDDFRSMPGPVKRFIGLEIYKKIQQNQNAALLRKVTMDVGGYSAQGTEIPGVPAGMLYMAATIIDRAIDGAFRSNNNMIKLLAAVTALPLKLYSFLITKAPSIGYGTALMFSPISFLFNIANLGMHMAGRPFIRISYDAKDKAWRYNGLTMQDIRNATGMNKLSAGELAFTQDEQVISVLKEGYTVQSNEINTFELKNPEIYTIGGQQTKTEIASVLAKQAIQQAAFFALISAFFDCPEEDDCQMSEFGRSAIKVFDLKGYGAMKQWLQSEGWFARNLGYRATLDPYGDPQHNTLAISPELGPLQARLPLNELNNAITAATIARVIDEMNAGIQLSKEDIMLRYMVYSHFDFLEENVDMTVEGLEEFKEVIFSFFDEEHTAAKREKKAAKSVAKRMVAALTPKLLNDLDKMLLDKENEHMYSTNADGFREHLAKNIPLNIPFLRRYVTENNPQAYEKTPFTYEWTDWQLYLKQQKEPDDFENFGLDTGKYILNKNGRATIKAPLGEVDRIKKQAVSSGRAEYKNNGYINTMAYFDRLYVNAIKKSNINILLDAGKKKEALDLMQEIAKEIKADPDFKIFKKEQLIPSDQIDGNDQ